MKILTWHNSAHTERGVADFALIGIKSDVIFTGTFTNGPEIEAVLEASPILQKDLLTAGPPLGKSFIAKIQYRYWSGKRYPAPKGFDVNRAIKRDDGYHMYRIIDARVARA